MGISNVSPIIFNKNLLKIFSNYSQNYGCSCTEDNINEKCQSPYKKKKNFMAPFYGWGSTASRLEPLRGGSLLHLAFGKSRMKNKNFHRAIKFHIKFCCFPDRGFYLFIF